MLVYKGVRDENGNMNWIEPKKLENYLVNVDFKLLDFLPEGFQAEVDNGMPYKSYKTATPKLTDSLYYSLAITNTVLPQHNLHNKVIMNLITTRIKK